MPRGPSDEKHIYHRTIPYQRFTDIISESNIIFLTHLLSGPVNLKYIHKYHRHRCVIDLENNYQINVSRDMKPALEKVIKELYD